MACLGYKIIDFHTHPFLSDKTNICQHISYCNMSAENTVKELKELGIDKICGSVVQAGMGKITSFEQIKALNDEALKLREIFNGYYIPGFHVHPSFKKESILEVERMSKLGVHLIGELVPYMQGWSDFSDNNFGDILEAVDNHKMVVSFHASGDEEMFRQMDKMVSRFKNINFVGAHLCEGVTFNSHVKRLADCPNYYVDLSGGGLYRHGTLRHVLTDFGKERVLFGSDYPVCNAAMYMGGVALDNLISEEEKEYVFYKNAQRLLNL